MAIKCEPTLVKEKLSALAEYRRNSLAASYGTPAQIYYDTLYWQKSSFWFGIEWEGHSYLLHATTEEAYDYADKLITTLLKEQGYDI